MEAETDRVGESRTNGAPARQLGAVSIAALAAGSLVALFLVPADARQGEIQRLMYVHVPTAWVAFLAFFVVFVMSILYLIQRRQRWDLVAASSAEIGVARGWPCAIVTWMVSENAACGLALRFARIPCA